MDRNDTPVVSGGGEEVYGIQREEWEAMVVTPRSFISGNSEAMRLELMARHGQDGDNDKRWFWATTALPENAEDRGTHGGKVFEL
jgi:hypothetical protein